jgi:hypothetical protein
MLKRTFQLLLVACLATGALWSANDPFVGDWKLNPSRSKLTDLMKVENLGGNKYAFDFVGDGSAETIVADGTDQTGVSGTTLSVSVETPETWKVVRKKDGRMLLTATWELSKDGNTLTDNYTEIAPNGSPSNLIYVYKRTAGGPGFAGSWVSTSETVNFTFVLQVRPYEGDGLSIIDSSEGLTRKMKLDGKDYPNVGPNAAIVARSSGRRLDEHTLELTNKGSNGKILYTEHIELSSDLKTLTQTLHTTGRREPNILVFERQ